MYDDLRMNNENRNEVQSVESSLEFAALSLLQTLTVCSPSSQPTIILISNRHLTKTSAQVPTQFFNHSLQSSTQEDEAEGTKHPFSP